MIHLETAPCHGIMFTELTERLTEIGGHLPLWEFINNALRYDFPVGTVLIHTQPDQDGNYLVFSFETRSFAQIRCNGVGEGVSYFVDMG